jgi:pyruvate formate lyase activating enzyme
MQIKGFQKTTFIDYPGKVASLIFTGGCNFRCPYCHNGGLVLMPGKYPTVMTETVVSHLEKRKDVVEGLVITGGEPTLMEGLEPFIRRVKKMGIYVKLDTNGTNPEVLQGLLQDNLLDYIAMDIKHSMKRYETITGIRHVNVNKIRESIKLIINSGIDHEFRTTMIRGVHTMEILNEMLGEIEGAKTYILQQYVKSESELMPNTFQTYTTEELEKMLDACKGQYNVENLSVRGKY